MSELYAHGCTSVVGLNPEPGEQLLSRDGKVMGIDLAAWGDELRCGENL